MVLNPDYERRKRELENVANALTQQVLSYWSQNPELRVMIDITKETERNQHGQPVAVPRQGAPARVPITQDEVPPFP